MKIGIVSDTHGNRSATNQAAMRFLEAGVAAVFHCGDIGGIDVLADLAAMLGKRNIPVHVVLGNVDLDSDDWMFFPSNLGIHLYGRFAAITLAGRKIAMLHGDDRGLFRELLASGRYDLLFSGHTHEVHDVRQGRTRCINPGSAGRGNPCQCAMLDLESDELSVFTIDV